jgi:hypothetical protein
VGKNFYLYQRKRTLILVIWGIANSLIGIGGVVRAKNKLWWHFWLQAFCWGIIDALIGLVGIRSQTKKLNSEDESLVSSEEKPSSPTLVKDIQNYHRILLINVFLDIGYIIGGELIRRWGVKTARLDRQGIGGGFQFQGLYLFFYDLTLTLEVKRSWLSK